MLFTPIIIAFFVMGIGFVLQKRVGFDQQSVTNILIYVTGPALIFSSMYTRHFPMSELLELGGAALAVMAVTGVFAWLAFRYVKHEGSGMLLPAMFMNSGYLGYPVALFALGELGLQKAIVYDAIETIVMFTLGVYIVHKENSHWREKLGAVFSIPLVYAISLGIALNFAAVPLPKTLIDALSMLGAATIPLALLALGGRLSTLKAGKLTAPLTAVFTRLAVGGITAFAFVELFSIHGVVGSVILLSSVMPPAVNSYVLNEKFSNDPDGAATAVLIGTLLSIIPIALVLASI